MGTSVWASGDGGAHYDIVGTGDTAPPLKPRYRRRRRAGVGRARKPYAIALRFQFNPSRALEFMAEGMMLSLRQWAWVAAVGVFSLLVFFFGGTHISME